MLQHRRAFIVIFIILSFIYVYRLHFIPRDSEATLWLRQIRRDGDVMNSTLGFEKIFVINLPSRPDRRDAMTLAGAVSNLSLTFLEGLTGENAPSSFSTGNSADRERSGIKSSHSPLAGARGSWRTHMSALQTIVDQGLGSALVLEDDVDWDVRLKTQMRTFAAASRVWLSVKEEKCKVLSRLEDEKTTTTSSRQAGKLAGVLSSTFSRKREQQDPRYQSPVMPGANPESDRERVIREEFERDTIPLSSSMLSSTSGGHRIHTESPYGDDWDVLWLGHCGADLPIARQDRSSSPLSSSSSPLSLKISLPDDVTVPAPKHLKPHPFALHDKLAAVYPAHTRVVHAAKGNICSLAYAVSQRGARKLLWRFTQEGFVYQWDLMLRDYCMGEYEDEGGDRRGGSGKEGGRKERGEQAQESVSPVCLTVQPPLINHHYAGEGITRGGGKATGGASVSNIRGQGGGFVRGKKGTPYVRLSVQENLRRLLAGFPVDGLVDQLPDDGSTLW
ncbi:hypothetical protein HD806DRAFT_375104 [Xylariaceae sp. AK1471]|nr:hypothetical protein HD806DRAFT_375104 [Xylariaceae sp. AK1471]